MSPPHASSRENYSTGYSFAARPLPPAARNQAPYLLPSKPLQPPFWHSTTNIKGGSCEPPLLRTFSVVYTAFTFSACHPLGPLTTSNCTCWPSCKLRNPPA